MAELRKTMDEIGQEFRDVPQEEFDRAVDRTVQESRSGPPPTLHALGSFESTRLIDPAGFADYLENTGTE